MKVWLKRVIGVGLIGSVIGVMLVGCERVKREDVPGRMKSAKFGTVEGCDLYVVDTGYNSGSTVDGVDIPSRQLWLAKCPVGSRVEWTQRSGKSTRNYGTTTTPDPDVEEMRRQARQKALEKLTPAEREVLGMHDE